MIVRPRKPPIVFSVEPIALWLSLAVLVFVIGAAIFSCLSKDSGSSRQIESGAGEFVHRDRTASFKSG